MGRRLIVFRIALVWVAAASLVASCSKKEETTKSDKAESTGLLQQIADQAQQQKQFSLGTESPELEKLLLAAGYEAKTYEAFPAQLMGRKGRMLIYASKNGGKPGGVIYLTVMGRTTWPVWHWYFDDRAPDGVTKEEINGDGLWDIRMKLGDGPEKEFVQAETFSLTGKGRPDWIALNNVTSSPSAEDCEAWKCFDGDTATVWRSSVANGEAFLEITVPFGLQRGLLTVRATESGQPALCKLYADGKMVQQIELAPTEQRQRVKLENAVIGSKKVRLVFESTCDGSDDLSIAELAIN